MIVHIPVSIGELVDKLSILRIKSDKIADEAKLKNVKHELSLLEDELDLPLLSIRDKSLEIFDDLVSKLKQVNETLWWIEDAIRDKEQKQEFDKEFVELARMVYQTNDERSRLKRAINDLLGSTLVEEKSYKSYR